MRQVKAGVQVTCKLNDCQEGQINSGMEDEVGMRLDYSTRIGWTYVELIIGGRLDWAVLGEVLDDLSGFLELGFRHGCSG